MAGVRPVPTMDEMRLLFDSFDNDRNHLISYSEVRLITRSGVCVRGGCFSRM